ncbi:MAG TPA: glucose-1-phosphate cytidylyltransferase [Candidatus Wunengus sp. YC65]|uniref:glucose-1-phosphate cytidylyltransferase n=1 Tax=Candidatus Wunengus sp. YC65 TaxID=3367701 RepID=UPI004026024D
MNVVILAGGLGTRLSEETVARPKPMVEIGGKPILWHIMNIYSAYGFNDFVLALGYKGEFIKEYFLNYYNFQSDLTISLKTGEVVASKNCYRDWTVQLADTGLNTMTGGRLHRLKDKLKGETFMLTYGDGVSNIDITKLLTFHKAHGKLATVSAVRPAARFGGISFDGNRVTEFKEKPQTGEGWINGGFFIFEPGVFDYLHGDNTVLEGDPLENIAKDGELMAFKHEGFWQCMDALRDRHLLENLWASGRAPWKVWKD